MLAEHLQKLAFSLQVSIQSWTCIHCVCCHTLPAIGTQTRWVKAMSDMSSFLSCSVDMIDVLKNDYQHHFSPL